MSRLTYDDLEAIVESYIGSDAITWSYVIDALGATQTNDSLVLLTELVFASREETFDITMTALAQLVALDACPPKVSQKCFRIVLSDADLKNIENVKFYTLFYNKCKQPLYIYQSTIRFTFD